MSSKPPEVKIATKTSNSVVVAASLMLAVGVVAVSFIWGTMAMVGGFKIAGYKGDGEQTGLWYQAPRLRVAAIKHSPIFTDRIGYEGDPSIMYPVAIKKVESVLETYNDLDVIILPEFTFNGPLRFSQADGEHVINSTVEINCPEGEDVCQIQAVEEEEIVCNQEICESIGIPEDQISQQVVQAISQLQQLAAYYGTQMLVGTVHERVKTPSNTVEIPAEYMYFNSLITIYSNGQIIGVRRKAPIPSWNTDAQQACKILLSECESFREIADQEDHPANICVQAIMEFAYQTVIQPHKLILDNGIEVSYFIVICSDSFNDEVRQRAQSHGIQNIDILFDSSLEGE